MSSRINVENYRAMVAKHAWAAWRRLPPQTRPWVGIDDLIQDGLAFIRYHAAKKYRKGGDVKFSTFLYTALENYYRTSYVHKFDSVNHTKLLDDIVLVSLGMLQDEFSKREGKLVDEGTALELAGVIRENEPLDELAGCLGVMTLLRVHAAASELLQKEIEHWFLDAETTKFHTHGRRFLTARREFRALANAHGFDIQGARHVLRSPICLDEVSRAIRCVPYDISNPTPALHRMDTVWRRS